jgi:hypothetical protein
VAAAAGLIGEQKQRQRQASSAAAKAPESVFTATVVFAATKHCGVVATSGSFGSRTAVAIFLDLYQRYLDVIPE